METRGHESLMKLLLSEPLRRSDRNIPERPKMPGKEADSSSRLSNYLQRLSGYGDATVSSVELDHCYSRPWNWRPENSNTKPVKTLFMNSTPNTVRSNTDSEVPIDPVGGDGSETRSPAYDIVKARHSMEESRKHIHLVRPDTGDSEWESKLDKSQWTPTQTKLFDRAVQLLNNDRLSRLTIAGNWNEPALRRVAINKTARRFRSTYSSVAWDMKLLTWLHQLLMENLDIPNLVSYVDVLQTLKHKIPSLIEKMIGNCTGTKFNQDGLNMVLQRPWDPVSHGLSCYNPKRLPGHPIILMVPNGISCPSGLTSRAQKWLSYFAHLGTVSTVTQSQIYPPNKMTLMSHLEHLLQITRSKIYELRSDYIGKNIILVGLNTGAALACQLALVEEVSAVVCLGFPLNTVDEKRGQPDDSLLNMRVPVLFVVGQHATSSNVDDLEDLRERLHVETGLVVVGAGDDQLRISKAKQMSEGITQTMVDRCIIDEVGDFLGCILCSPYRNDKSRMMADRKRKFAQIDSYHAKKQHPNSNLGYNSGGKKGKNVFSANSRTSVTKTRFTTSPVKQQGFKSSPGSFRTPEKTITQRIPVDPLPILSNSDGCSSPARHLGSQIPQIKVLGSEEMKLEDALTLVEELTPDRLLEMPVIIAHDDSNQSPLKVLVNGKTTEIRSPVPSLRCIAPAKLIQSTPQPDETDN